MTDMIHDYVLERKVDLDDLATYSESDKAKNSYELKSDCYNLLGFALLYMNYLQNKIDWAEQKGRVEELIYKLKYSTHPGSGESDKLYWLKFKYSIENETENMC